VTVGEGWCSGARDKGRRGGCGCGNCGNGIWPSARPSLCIASMETASKGACAALVGRSVPRLHMSVGGAVVVGRAAVPMFSSLGAGEGKSLAADGPWLALLWRTVMFASWGDVELEADSDCRLSGGSMVGNSTGFFLGLPRPRTVNGRGFVVRWAGSMGEDMGAALPALTLPPPPAPPPAPPPSPPGGSIQLFCLPPRLPSA